MDRTAAEQLLNDLVNGLITPQEFKSLATAPKWALIFYAEHGNEHIWQMDPEDMTIVIIDGVKKEMRWKEFEAFRDQWPDAEYLPIMFFDPEQE